jgi:GT2 family glycosyltransferase
MPADAAPAPRLSVILLNHNSGDLLRACLDSIFAKPPPFDFEVIVPDNASADSSLKLAAEAWGDQIRIINNGANKGFAWGNNRGIEVSRGEYVCILNPDTVVRPGALSALVHFLDNNQRAGFVGPKVVKPGGTFQRSSKRSIPTPFDAISRALLLSRIFPGSQRFARYEMTYLDEDQAQKVEACDGCCMMVRQSVIAEIGKLDEGYFIYCEDVDWFLRASWAGWEVWYYPEAVIEHHHAHTQSFRRYRTVRDFHNSMIRFHRKFYAARYPSVVNALIYRAVRARMYLIMARRTFTGWN